MNLYKDKFRSSLFTPSIAFSLLILIVTIVKYIDYTQSYFNTITDDGSVTVYLAFLPIVILFSLIMLLLNGLALDSKLFFIWCALGYVMVTVFSTMIAGQYSGLSFVLRVVYSSYWLSVLILSYYAVVKLDTVKLYARIVLLFLPVLSYFVFMSRNANLGGDSYSMIGMNSAYFVSYFMPVIFIVRPDWLKYPGLLLIFIVILFSYKRTAFLTYGTSIVTYFFIFTYVKKRKNLVSLFSIFFLLLVSLLLLVFVAAYLSHAYGISWGERFSSVSEDRGSGRLEIWTDVWNYMKNQDMMSWLIGNGYGTIVSFNRVHNEFLEVLLWYGVFGFIFYIMFFVSLCKIFFEMLKFKYVNADAFAVSLVWFFFGSMLSQLIMVPQYFLSLCFFWGWTIADYHNAKKYQDSRLLCYE